MRPWTETAVLPPGAAPPELGLQQRCGSCPPPAGWHRPPAPGPAQRVSLCRPASWPVSGKEPGSSTLEKETRGGQCADLGFGGRPSESGACPLAPRALARPRVGGRLSPWELTGGGRAPGPLGHLLPPPWDQGCFPDSSLSPWPALGPGPVCTRAVSVHSRVCRTLVGGAVSAGGAEWGRAATSCGDPRSPGRVLCPCM